jgi:hypothetical protein
MQDDHTLVYTPGGTVAHVLDSLLSPNSFSPTEAMCGRTAWPSQWHGTGSQEEIEKALDLSRCASCQAVLNHRYGWAVR